MRFQNKILGIKLENKGSVDKPKVRLTVFSSSKLSQKLLQKLLDRGENR